MWQDFVQQLVREGCKLEINRTYTFSVSLFTYWKALLDHNTLHMKMGPSSRFLKIRKKRTHILKCVRSLYTSKRCLDHSITVHHQSLQGSFTIYNSYSTVYTLCGLQGSKHLLCYYNNSNTVQQIEDQGGRGEGKKALSSDNFTCHGSAHSREGNSWRQLLLQG